MDTLKKAIWLGDSLESLRDFPEAVQDAIGYSLHKVQEGQTPRNAKPLIGIKPVVMEIVALFDTNTYRAVYTTKIGDVVFVLHCFMKKSTKGIKTPKPAMDLIKQRLKDAFSIAQIKR